MKVYCGDYELIESKTIIQIDNEPIEFILEDSANGNLNIEFIFKDDAFSKYPDTKFDLKGGNKLEITVLNLSKANNGGLVKPTKVGTFRGKELFINYRVFSFSEKSAQKTVIFNAYLKK